MPLGHVRITLAYAPALPTTGVTHIRTVIGLHCQCAQLLCPLPCSVTGRGLDKGGRRVPSAGYLHLDLEKERILLSAIVPLWIHFLNPTTQRTTHITLDG